MNPKRPVYSPRTIKSHAELVKFQRYFFGKETKEEDMSYYELGGDGLIAYEENDPEIGAEDGYSDDSLYF